MMTPTNGHADDKGPRVNDTNEMLSMEMESLHPGSTTVRKRQTQPSDHPLSQLWLLIKLHIESYPKIFSTVGLVALAFLMYMAVEWSKPSLSRHKVSMDYSDISLDYNFRAAQIDHWCLFGGDNACSCEDFTEPIPRDEVPGWLDAHEANKKRWLEESDPTFDVVFLGDDVIEELNGECLNAARPGGQQIAQDFQESFNSDGRKGLALGIAGDSTSNLLWRIDHGEMPDDVVSKVWWINIGSNDLSRGGCSEEATVLGILRVAEEVMIRNPYSRVVIQGILPRSMDGSGNLAQESGGLSGNKLFGKRHSESYYAEEARKKMQLWPSIQAINNQLEEFCKDHPTIVYVDVNALFVGSVTNALFRSDKAQIVSELMPDYDGRLSPRGHDKLNKVINQELMNIILDEDDLNDIVDEKGNDVVDEDNNVVVPGKQQNGNRQ